ncbi:MAG: flagellar biosynthetic protein FliO [Pseudomonadota bacterium]
MGAPDYFRIVFSFIAVIGLIGAFAILAPRLGARLRVLSRQVGIRRPASRLALIETLSIDPKRRIAIIQCDDQEHLILIGATSETLIASPVKHPTSPTKSDASDNNDDDLLHPCDDNPAPHATFAPLLSKSAA